MSELNKAFEKVDFLLHPDKERLNEVSFLVDHLISINENSEYQKFFKSMIDKEEKSINSMTDKEKKIFFNKVKKGWTKEKE